AVLVFVFQAEDGIRDRNVTGVQTCALPIYRQTGWVELNKCWGSKERTLLVCTHQSACIRVLSQSGHMVHVAVATGTQDNCVTGMSLELTGDQGTGNDAAGALRTVVLKGSNILHIVVSKKLHVAESQLAVKRRGRRQLQLLTCLSTGVVGAGNLHTTEGTGSQGAAVFTSEWRTDCVHVVNNAWGFHRQAPAVRLTATVVAALNGVFCVTVSGVVVNLLRA